MAQSNHLSSREWEVIKLLLQGKSNKLIASSLGISVRTVEFHLKNIYAKFQVSSRIELILILVNNTGAVEIEKLGYSTVDGKRDNADNKDRKNSRLGLVTSFRDTISFLDQELDMKSHLRSKHVVVGMFAALFTGLVWVSALLYAQSLPSHGIKGWAVPLTVIFAIIGLSIGLIGKHNGNTLRKVFLSALFGTGLSPFAIIPIMVSVVLPLGKLAEWYGLINPSTISSDVATMITMIAMTAIWFVIGIAIGVTFLFVTIQKPKWASIQRV